MEDVGRAIGLAIGGFIGGLLTIILFAACVAWGGWRILKLLTQPQKQYTDFILPVLAVLLGIIGFIWSP